MPDPKKLIKIEEKRGGAIVPDPKKLIRILREKGRCHRAMTFDIIIRLSNDLKI